MNYKQPKLRYVAYLRKSTEDEERQVLSKDAQRDKISERFSDLNIVEWLDESKSAFEPDKRPVFAKILEKLDNGELDGIVAWHPDRLSRNEVDASSITWRIRKGIIKDLKFANFSYDDSPEGMMMLQMTMSQSQYFSAKLSKDVMRGNEKKRKNGGLTGTAPEGYLNDRLKRTVYKDPLRFSLMRKAFDLYLTGDYSVQAIARIMNEDWGYLTVKRNKVGGKPISGSALYRIFNNVRYAGLVPDPHNPGVFYTAAFPAMITPEEYDKVQELLGRTGCIKLTTHKHFVLRGLIRCGECACMVTAEQKVKRYKNGTSKTYIYYHCTGKRACSQKKYIDEDTLFDKLSELLNDYELIPKFYDWGMAALREMAAQEVKERDNVQAMQYNAIGSLQEQLDRLLDMATRGMVDDETYQTKSEALKEQLAEATTKQQEIANRSKNWYDYSTNMLEKLTQANEKFVEGELADKKEILLAIGQNPRLMDGELAIQSNEWLVPIKNSVKSLRAEYAKVPTLPKQIQEAQIEALRSQWCG